jgi:hypothetical protein
MKTIRLFLMACLITLFMSGNAQNTTFALVDFMRVPENDLGKYVQLEKDIWKPMHQEWINQGKLDSWSLWKVPYPGGTNAEYHYVTVRLYSNSADVENPMQDMDAVFKKVHAGKDMNKLATETLASRDLVKTFGFSRWGSFFDPKQTEPSKILTVVSFNIPMDKWATYQEMEKKYFHPTHKAEIEAGYRSGWEGWQLQRPFGMNHPYQFVAVDHYKDWSQFTKPKPESIYKNAISEDDLKKRNALFYETVKLVNFEEWHLVDFVNKKPAATTAKK